jgi:3-deoxy-alpha-D-manno-octulosonate 8-oxidase
MSSLDTGIKNVRNVQRYTIGKGSLDELGSILNSKRKHNSNYVLFFIDEYFEYKIEILKKMNFSALDVKYYVQTKNEPTTDEIDKIVLNLRENKKDSPVAIVGFGGGATMDVAKAVSNLLTNPGKAENYQGWDLVINPGIFKIGIPTISGTGAEATRTCVMTNKKSGLKLGMNSDHTVFDQIIMDPDLTMTVPRNQYFYTGMDAYIHCIEALAGSYRNAIGDAYSRETINLCRKVFLEGDMMTIENRERLMVASYLGGCAIATSYVGLVHPLSAALSVVLGLHHCIANCIVMNYMNDYYKEEYEEFQLMVRKQGIEIPTNICKDLTEDQFQKLYESTIIHEKPLINALGPNFREKLTFEHLKEIFKKM